MSAPERLSQFADLLDPSFRKIFGDEYKQLPQVMPKIFKVENSTKNSEKVSAITGFSKLIKKNENGAIQYESREQGYDVTYSHNEYALGAEVTQIMMEDDQYGQIKKIAQGLAKAANRTTEKAGADVFNNAFTAGGGGDALFTSGDALALLSGVHTSPVSGVAVQSNVPASTHKALTEDSLKEAKIAMGNTLDMKGEKILVNPTQILLPNDLEFDANILLKTVGRVGSAANDINPVNGMVTPMLWAYLTSATAWFLIDPSVATLSWYWRRAMNVDGPEVDFDTKAIKYSIDGRWSLGFDDWRGVFGSKGDGTAV